MALPIGVNVGVSPQGLAKALKGQVWGLEINGVMCDVEFNGHISGNNVLLAKVLRKSRTTQQMLIKKE